MHDQNGACGPPHNDMEYGAPYASALCNIDHILNQDPHIDALRNNYTTRTHMDFGSIHPLPLLNLYLWYANMTFIATSSHK